MTTRSERFCGISKSVCVNLFFLKVCGRLMHVLSCCRPHTSHTKSVTKTRSRTLVASGPSCTDRSRSRRGLQTDLCTFFTKRWLPDQDQEIRIIFFLFTQQEGIKIRVMSLPLDENDLRVQQKSLPVGKNRKEHLLEVKNQHVVTQTRKSGKKEQGKQETAMTSRCRHDLIRL